MRADPIGGRASHAPVVLNPAAFCRLLDNQRFPDLGFLEILGATYAPWHDPDYLAKLTLRHQVSRETVTKTLIVRPCGDSCESIFRAARELWARVFCRSDNLGMALPVGCIPERGLLLQALPDGPTLQALIAERRDTPSVVGVRTLARWLAKLHAAIEGCESLPIRLESDLSADLHACAAHIVRHSPAHRAYVMTIVDELQRVWTNYANPLQPTLGNLSLAQLFVHNDAVAPADFSQLALGDPAADLGLLCANLEIACQTANAPPAATDRLIDALTAEYRRHGGLEPIAMMPCYMAYGYLRHAADAIATGTVANRALQYWLDRANLLLRTSTAVSA